MHYFVPGFSFNDTFIKFIFVILCGCVNSFSNMYSSQCTDISQFDTFFFWRTFRLLHVCCWAAHNQACIPFCTSLRLTSLVVAHANLQLQNMMSNEFPDLFWKSTLSPIEYKRNWNKNDFFKFNFLPKFGGVNLDFSHANVFVRISISGLNFHISLSNKVGTFFTYLSVLLFGYAHSSTLVYWLLFVLFVSKFNSIVTFYTDWNNYSIIQSHNLLGFVLTHNYRSLWREVTTFIM